MAWTAPGPKNATSHVGILPFAVIRRRAAGVFEVWADGVKTLANLTLIVGAAALFSEYTSHILCQGYRARRIILRWFP
jgi:hypothetical protein